MLGMFLESLNNLFSKPETVKYPYEPSPEPEGFRGEIYYNEELCIFCDKCENVCPPGAIIFDVVDIESGKKEYNYNPYLCIYCGACVDVCPKADEGCLVQSNKRPIPLGRTLPRNEKFGYLINIVENPREFEKEWSKLEIRAKENRAKHKEFKKQQRAKKAAAKKAEKNN
ncbi:4Fe-4S binding protein [Caminibacter sp.]